MKIDNKFELIDEAKAPPMFSKIELFSILVYLAVFFLLIILKILKVSFLTQIFYYFLPFSYVIGLFILISMTYKTIKYNFIKQEEYFYRTNSRNYYRLVFSSPPIGKVKKITGKLAIMLGIIKIVLLIPIYIYAISMFIYAVFLND